MTPKKFGLDQYTLDRFFEKVVNQYSEQPSLALVGEKPFTYEEFGKRVEALRENLLQNGFGKGDKIVILGNGSPQWAVAFMAITTMGAIAVPVMEDFPENDIDHIIHHSDAIAIFISDSLFQGLNLNSLKKLKVIIRLDDFSIISDDASAGLWDQVQKLLRQSVAKSAAPPAIERHMPEINEDDVAEILYTSGTTGQSKGVMLTHKNLVSNLFEGPDMLNIINEKSVILAFLPMAHAFGSTSAFLSIIYCGSSIYYLNKKPSPKILMNAMKEVQPHIIGAVPLVFEKIYHKQVLPALSEKPMLRLISRNRLGRKMLYRTIGRKIMKAFGGRLQCAIIGGASLNYEVELFLREGGVPFSVGYGLSECSPLVTFSSVADARIGAVGTPISDVSIKIADPDPESGVGEILVKGPNVMQGYYKNEKETRKVFTEDGWFITGDRGYIDKDGFLFIKGRSKNVIIGASGENIYPEVVEEKLKESLYVEEALVYLMDDELVARIYPDYGYIQNLEDGKIESEIALDIEKLLETVRQEVNANLPAASRLRKVVEQPEPFIKTPTNKIKRAEYIPDYLK